MTAPKAKALLVAGVMSGTSADGVDVALCRIGPGSRTGDTPRVKLLGHVGFPYPKSVRAEVLRMMAGGGASAAELSRLNWRLGAVYAECVEKAAAKFGVRPALVGLHGQTVHHETAATRFLGASVRSTWQIGEAAVVAERMRCPVVSDLRPADLAAGGQGAPLVPMLDYCLFRSAKVNRVLLNLGGIANLTTIPAGGGLEDVIAFDTGPANMVIDACMQRLFGKPFDRDGAVAQSGSVDAKLLNFALRSGYFSAAPPKSCGREQFGSAFVDRYLARAAALRVAPQDVVATATELTAATVFDAYDLFCRQDSGVPTELLAAGGGTRNPALMQSLANLFGPEQVRVRSIESFGIPSQAKEAVAFALLAWLSVQGMVGNVPSATGATHSAVLGKLSFGKSAGKTR